MQEKPGNPMSGPLQISFSPAIKAGDYIFLSGQTGYIESQTGKPIEGIEAQTRQCLNNMDSVLRGNGVSLDDVVKVNIFLKNEKDFPIVNDIYCSYFKGKKPARSTIVTGLSNPLMLIEMDCIAYQTQRR